jgi:hypothetical protein
MSKESFARGRTQKCRIFLFRLDICLYRVRLHTSIKPHDGIPPGARNLFKFAHLSRDVSSIFGSHDRKLCLTNPVGILATEAIAMIASSR